MTELPSKNVFQPDMNDLWDVARQLWDGRKIILLTTLLFLIIGGGYSLYKKLTVIPEYESRVTLHLDPPSPESTTELFTGSAFLTEVMHIPLIDPGTGQRIRLKEILIQKTKPPQATINGLSRRILLNPGSSGILNLSVIMQDPLLAPQLADSVAQTVVIFLVEFKTQRAQMNLQYLASRCREAEASYEQSIKALTGFYDHHAKKISGNDTIALKLLQDEKKLRYNVYTELALQFEKDAETAQKEIPIIKVIDHATVAFQNNKQETGKISMIMLFLGFTAGMWIVLGRNSFARYRKTANRKLE